MNEFNSLATRLAQVWERMGAACERAGRAPDEVALLPVSKTVEVDILRAAAELGLRRFGENRVQEIVHKQADMADLAPHWVMIGHLQTNKARDAARLADEVQSLDRLSLAQALDQRLQTEGRAIDVLIQVKTSTEPSKFGLPAAETSAFLKQLQQYDTLRVCGLMTMAVNSTDESAVRACFRMLRDLRDRLRSDGAEELNRLSMGMSGDFEWAIEEGATEVRIGSALFGARDYV